MLRFTENLKTRNHQEIMDICYELWQENEDLSRCEFLEKIEEKFGKDAKLLVQLGNYNYQVCNGGHHQYFDNGYCDNVSGCGLEHDEEIPLHKEMIKLLEESEFTECKSYQKVVEIMKKFNVEYTEGYDETYTCYECSGYGEYEDEDENGEIINVECEECGGSGEIGEYEDEEYYIDDSIDDEYYEVNDIWMEEIQDFLNKSV